MTRKVRLPNVMTLWEDYMKSSHSASSQGASLNSYRHWRVRPDPELDLIPMTRWSARQIACATRRKPSLECPGSNAVCGGVAEDGAVPVLAIRSHAKLSWASSGRLNRMPWVRNYGSLTPRTAEMSLTLPSIRQQVFLVCQVTVLTCHAFIILAIHTHSLLTLWGTFMEPRPRRHPLTVPDVAQYKTPAAPLQHSVDSNIHHTSELLIPHGHLK
eukprot:scpid39878/ scgid19100/ 